MPSLSASLGETVAQLQDANDQLRRRIRELEGELEATQYTAAASDVLAERKRQVEVEGWTPEHDDTHNRAEMARAAACYAAPDDVSYTDSFGRSLGADGEPRAFSVAENRRSWSYVQALRWPWAKRWWKPTDRRRNLVKAGALILAEIERIDRASIDAEEGEL